MTSEATISVQLYLVSGSGMTGFSRFWQPLTILENLFSCYYSCIKWNNAWSTVFEINFGVRQGSVLSQFLFAVYDLSR